MYHDAKVSMLFRGAIRPELTLQRLQNQEKDIEMFQSPAQLHTQRPARFENLNEARKSLGLVLNHLTAFFLNIEVDDKYYDLAVTSGEKHLLFVPWLESWESAFSELLAGTQTQMIPSERQAAMTLKAHHLVAEVLSQVDLSQGDLAWDAFLGKFAAIVNLATAVVEDTKRSSPPLVDGSRQLVVGFSSTMAALSSNLGIVDPLREVVARCRDPVVRRQALGLLATLPRQECMWSSWSAWKVGKFLMHLEEEGTEAEAPNASESTREKNVMDTLVDSPDRSSGPMASQKPRIGCQRMVPRASAR